MPKIEHRRSWLATALGIIEAVAGIAAVVISIVALNVATESYWDAKESAIKQERVLKQQQASLDASRHALLLVVDAILQEKEISEQSAKRLSDLADVVEKQRQEELKRAAAKPIIRISFGDVSPDRIDKNETFRIAAETNPLVADHHRISFDFHIVNVGDAPLLDPRLRVIATPAVVGVSERGGTPGGRTTNSYQLGGLNIIPQVPPFSVSKSTYTFPIDVHIPRDIDQLELYFSVIGSNAPTTSRNIRIHVVRQLSGA